MKLTKKPEVIILRLQKAIDAKSAELEIKNRELEIETSLEKVRTVAMGMKKADDMLSICKTISQQLAKLGVKEIRNVQTAIFYESQGTYMNYEYYAKHDRTFITELDFKNHKIQLAFAKKMMKGPNEEVLEHLKGKKLQDWYAYQKTTNQFADKFILKAHSLNYYWYSLGPVALGTSTYYPLTKEETDLFKRFLKVFELAYRRYLDIEKATAQAREAQIEASLEKVRAQALGMRKAEDLPNVCEVLYKELQTLGFPELRNAMVNIHDDGKRTFVNYDYSDEIGKSITPLFYDIHPVIKKQIKQIRSADDAFSETVFKGKDLESWKAFRKSRGEKEDKRIKNSTALYYYFYSIGTGSIGISTFNQIAKEKQEVLKRFRNVFAFAYRRYMDVAQAEAQTREAQIEASLERIRSASLAMMDSSALSGIIYKLYGELTKLDAQLDRCFIMIVNPENKGITWWMAGQEGLLAENGFFVQMNQHASHLWYLDCWKKRRKKWQYLLEGKEKRDWDRFGFNKTELERLPEFIKKFMAGVNKINLTGSSDQFGSLVTGSFEPLPEEQQEIISRFSIAFNQAYIRFLDLQKAETQAREAQIEAALERVRSRSMAMHSSQELNEVALELRKQMGLLGQKDLEVCAIHLYDEETSFESWSAMRAPGKEGEVLQTQARFPNKGIKIVDELMKHKKRGSKDYVLINEGEKMVEWFKVMKQHAPELHASIMQSIGKLPVKKLKANWSVADFSGGALIMVTYGEPDAQSRNLLRRSANVFEQAYIRFLDLQKAEAQTREAEIELGLERVRARAMAMQKSDELSNLVDTVFKELTKLDFALNWCIINIIDELSLTNMVWAANPETNKPPESYLMKFEDYPFHHSMLKGYQERKTKHVYVIEGKEKKTYDDYLFTKTEWRRVPKAAQAASRAMKRYVATFSFSNFGGLQTVGEEYMSEENLDILSRFGKVFDLTYTRFNDLQKAEAQAREAQIETALERVRSRSMGMQKSEELKEVIKLVYQQLIHLKINLDHAGFVVDYKPKEDWHFWIADEQDIPSKITHPYFESVWATQFNEAKEKGADFFTTHLNFEEKNNFYNELLSYVPGLPEASKDFYLSCPGLAATTVVLEDIGLYIENFSGIPYTNEENKTLMRFGKVFQQTYTRFLDLQKAEAQAREAKIEAALERTRTQSMIMQHSNELDDTLRVFHQQVLLLGIPSAFSFLWLPDEEKSNHIFWAAWAEDNNNATVFKSKAISYPLDRNEPATKQCLIDWRSDEPVVSYAVPPEGVKNYFAAWQELIDGVEKLTPAHFTNGLYYVEAFMKYGCFGVILENDLDDDEKKILNRFTVEFERAYTRFLDLQKAEAQAREAQIEAALEKVRSRTMAMQNSNELQETAAVLFREFKKLGTDDVYQVTIGIYNEIKQLMDFRVTSWANNGEQESRSFNLDMNEPTLLQPAVAAWKAGKKSAVFDLTGEALQGWLNYRNKISGITVNAADTEGRRIITAAYFSKGHLTISTPLPPPEETIKTLERFAVVFDSTYTRFLDLEKAEAQARQAKIEAAMEKVRSKAMAMQKPSELVEVAELLRKEMGLLGVEELETSSIYIHHEETAKTECWYALKDVEHPEKELVSDYMNIELNKTDVGKQMLAFYNSDKKQISIPMQGDARKEWINYCATHSKVLVGFYGDNIPDRTYHLYKFSNGFMGAASPGEISSESWDLLQRATAVFSLAYTRFNDLQIAEAHALQAEQDLIEIKAARKKAEETLTELQQTQKQLIQSEKMASLGELTAGIAHEIQNPLNFVNNFSEVSNELIDEMKTEFKKGDTEEGFAIADDIKQNLEKILHHGKRADAIVKGMLQHSSSGSGKKEPTDINKLADEYLRLAYHGLRAKDKSFNATMKTDFDEAIGNINIIPQDIGRVILNLITNAFYVVDEKKKTGIENYEPTVSVNTKKEGNQVFISVKDNGMGVPQKILDKIFQPFFTTKPTGQGTGLGLSLSYDIVKAHGGELKVETKEGEGTEFIIVLPV